MSNLPTYYHNQVITCNVCLYMTLRLIWTTQMGNQYTISKQKVLIWKSHS
jgi:hypothetical protein